MTRFFRRRKWGVAVLCIPRHMAVAAFLLFGAYSFAQSVDYSKLVSEYQEGNLSSVELLKILDGASVSSAADSHLDQLASKFLSELNTDDVNASFFPGIDGIIRSFVGMIKNDAIRNALGFIFPPNKCDTDLILKQEGARSIAETFKMAGKEPPTWINKYLVK